MGSEEGESANEATVRRLYDLFNSGEFDPDLIDPEVEYVNPSNAVEPGTRRGVEALREALDKVREGFGAAEIRRDRIEEDGYRIAVAITMRIRAPGSGIEVDVPQIHLMTFRDDGRVARVEWSSDADHAFEALRAPPGP